MEAKEKKEGAWNTKGRKKENGRNKHGTWKKGEVWKNAMNECKKKEKNEKH